MNQDNRGHVFEVLHKLASAEYLTDNVDSRQQIIQVFEYVMSYFSAWFEEDESHKALGKAWNISCVLEPRAAAHSFGRFFVFVASLGNATCSTAQTDSSHPWLSGRFMTGGRGHPLPIPHFFNIWLPRSANSNWHFRAHCANLQNTHKKPHPSKSIKHMRLRFRQQWERCVGMSLLY